MRYDVGDIVKIVNKELDSYGTVGKIVDIDEEWMYPYEVNFGEFKFEDTLFSESDLVKIDGEVIKNAEMAKHPRDFINIVFQDGVVSENGVNGAQIEDVIDLLVERLVGFQKGDFPCRENALAITHLQEAQNWLYRRTMERKKQGVEGKNKKHE